MVVGLQKSPEKNGAIGVLKAFVTEKDRWAVEFASGTTNNFKIENLQVGGCQNYGPFLDPYKNTAPHI